MAGFHDNGSRAGPNDVEAKLIRADAETAIARFNPGLPQRGRTKAKGRSPTRRARQIVDCRRGSIGDTLHTRGGVPAEVHSRQVGAPLEHPVPHCHHTATYDSVGQTRAAMEHGVGNRGNTVGHRYAGEPAAILERALADADDAAGDRHTGKATATIERPGADTDDAVGNHYAGQARTAGKGSPFDVGNAVRNGESAGFALRTLKKRSLALVVQHAFQAAIGGIVWIHVNPVQAAATIKRIVRHQGETASNGGIDQAAAVRKSSASDGGDAIRDCD